MMTRLAQRFLPPDAPPLGSGLAWVEALRATALEKLCETDLPTPAWEEWKYTSLRALETVDPAQRPGAESKADESRRLLDPAMPAVRVTISGASRAVPSMKLPRGVTVAPLSSVIKSRPEWVQRYLVNLGRFGRHPMLALNTAGMSDGLVIHLEKGVRLPEPIEALFWAEGGGAVHQRHLIVLDEGAEATFLEVHGGKGPGFSNHVFDIFLEKSAILRHYRSQDESKEAVHVTTSFLTLFDRSSYDGFALTTGAGLSRHEITADLLDSGISCIFGGAYLVNGGQHADTTIRVGHLGPSCTSSQMYRGVIDDQARSVFQGKIQVSRAAQKTDGCQSHHALLLSEEAQVSAKPELEIETDDVACRHGAAAGQIDKDALFYLKARGIPHAEAVALLVRSFLAEALGDAVLPCLREAVTRRIDTWLDGR